MDKPLSPFARLVLFGAGFLAVTAGPVLFLLPEHTAVYFAWTIAHPLTPVFMGASYMAGVGNLVAIRANRWSLARVQIPAIISFALFMLLATLLHLPVFNWQHPIAWAWLAVYVISPPAALLILVRAERNYRPPPPSGPLLPSSFGPVMVTLALLDGLLGIALFLVPERAMILWPWSLTPLTARVIGGWLLGGMALQWMLARQRSLDTAYVGLLANIIIASLLLLGTIWQWSAMDGSSLAAAYFLLRTTTIGGFSVYSWSAATRLSTVTAK